MSATTVDSAFPSSENTPRALMIGRTTMASNSPAGTLIRSLRSTCTRTGFRSGLK